MRIHILSLSFIVGVRMLRKGIGRRLSMCAFPPDCNAGLQVDPPRRLPAPVYVHGHRVHDSHAAGTKGLFTFCGLCGCWAEFKPRDLRMECQVALNGPVALTAYNCEALGRLRKGNPPKKKCLDWGSTVDTFIDL